MGSFGVLTSNFVDWSYDFEARNSKKLADLGYKLEGYFDQIKNCMN